MTEISADRPAGTAETGTVTPDPKRERPAYWAKKLTDEDAEWVRRYMPLQALPETTEKAA